MLPTGQMVSIRRLIKPTRPTIYIMKKLFRWISIPVAMLTMATISMPAHATETRSIQKDATSGTRVVRKTNSQLATEKKGAVLASKMNMRKAPSRSSEMPAMYGCILYNDLFDWYTDTYLGTVPNSADAQSSMISDMVNASYGGVEVDGIYYATNYYYDEFWEEEEFTIEGYSLITGERLCSFYPKDYRLACVDETYDPTTKSVYGITFTESGNGLQLSKLSYSTSNVSAETVNAIEGNWTSIVCDNTGQLYGIRVYSTATAELYKIDKTNAKIELVGSTGLMPYYSLSGSVIDQETNRLYWLYCDQNESYMTDVNLSTGAATILYKLKNNDQIAGIVIPTSAMQSTEPAATSASLTYHDGTMTVTWNPVESSITGSPLEADKITYTVTRADGSVAAEGLTATSFSEKVDDNGSYKMHYYEVTVVYDSTNASKPSKTNLIYTGAYNPPYTSDFYFDNLSGWTVIDANGDGIMWGVYDGEDEASIGYNPYSQMNDWLISPALRLEKNKVYYVNFTAHSSGAGYPERFEVKCGKSATIEGMTTVLLKSTQVDNENPVQFTAIINPDEDGIWYIGFHGISSSNMDHLFLGNVTVESGLSKGTPDAATDLRITDLRKEKLTVEVSFRAPSFTISGNPLETLTKVEVSRNGDLVKTFENPTPGELLSFEDMPNNGTVEYSVVGYNEEGKGLPATISEFVGINLGAAPANVQIERTESVGEVIVTWNAVTKDIDGRTLTGHDVRYIVAQYENGQWNQKSEPVSELSYTYQAVSPDNQQFVQCAVFSFVDGQVGKGKESQMIPVGKPYDGIEESFANGTPKYQWGSEITGNFTYVDIFSDDFGVPAADGDNGYLGVCCPTFDDGAKIFSGLISLVDMKEPIFKFSTWNFRNSDGDIDDNIVKAYVKPVDSYVYTEIFSAEVNDICNNMGKTWGEASLDLSQYAGQVVQVQLASITEMYVYTLFDAIKVTDNIGLGAEELEAKSTSISAGRGCITVESANGENLSVVGADGIRHFNGISKGNTTINVPAGMYIVKAGNVTKKLLVK